MSEKQGTLFDERFLGKHAGAIMSDPTTALVELVANCWDAYASEVNIVWPESKSNTPFSIFDNGCGMTRDEFSTRWRTLDYDRLAYQGNIAPPPPELLGARPRKVYGYNGRGRHAAFHFSSPYQVITTKNGVRCTFNVSQGRANPIEVDLVSEETGDFSNGTEIRAVSVIASNMSGDDVRAVLSTRFLLDPQFAVNVDSISVTFNDVPVGQLKEVPVSVPGYGVARLRVMSSSRTDRTSKQHGIAWWVNRRIVGEAGWGAFVEKMIDGRTEEAKRHSFVIEADFLTPEDIWPDWSGFRDDQPRWMATKSAIHEQIRIELSELLSAKRKQTRSQIVQTYATKVDTLPRISQDRWNAMLDELIERCPSLGETQLDQVMGILANLELAQSQYSFLEKLHRLTPSDLEDWNRLFDEWTAKTAKEALDEIARRLKLIEEIRQKTASPDTSEVQELQPLFGKSLWIFGPEFESIEFTSNRGMTSVIQSIFKVADTGSLKRPDFVILPDGSAGFYDRPSFDSDHNQRGVDTLIIVELKRPGISLGSKEKDQVWSYITELRDKGLISTDTRVTGFLLGSLIAPHQGEEVTHGDRTRIRPMLYSTFIGQAEKRMMNLHRRIADAPFMQKYLPPPEPKQISLLDCPNA